VLEHAAADPRAARRRLLVTWAKAIGLLAGAKLLSLVEPTGLLGANLAGVAAVLFVVLSDREVRRRGERWVDHGLPWWGAGDPHTWRAWGRGLVVGLGTCALLFPPFALAFVGWAGLLPELPQWAARLLGPYALPPRFQFRLPDRFALLALNQLLVVALPEEIFYRGWMQTTWAASLPGRRVSVLGAPLGRGFLATQALFALGHLVVLQPWRLGTFFPGLLFGWLRARTGDLAVPVVVHALSNLLIATLEASFYGG
jgi:membrane protease YdiL (CAAX protease family)